MGAKTIAINKLTHHIYLSATDFEKQTGSEKPMLVSGSFVVLDIVPQN